MRDPNFHQKGLISQETNIEVAAKKASDIRPKITNYDYRNGRATRAHKESGAGKSRGRLNFVDRRRHVHRFEPLHARPRQRLHRNSLRKISGRAYRIEIQAEYKNPILAILARAGVPKVRGEIMQNDLGEDFAQKVAADPSHIQRLFPRIKGPGTEAILTACRKSVAGNEIVQAMNAVGASQKGDRRSHCLRYRKAERL